MGTLNDFFLATEEELDGLDAQFGPWPPPASKKWPWQRRRPPEPATPSLPVIEAKGILDVELATLERILHGEPLDDVDAVVDLIEDAVRQEPPSDPSAWIVPVSDRLVKALLAADDAALHNAADSWIETEEMQMSGWTRDEAAELLLRLREFCRQAEADGRRAYRWVSL